MPNLIEERETLYDLLYKDHAHTQPLALPSSEVQRRPGMLALLRSLLARGSTLRSWRNGQDTWNTQRQETPQDLLARHHPYIYIKSMSG